MKIKKLREGIISGSDKVWTSNDLRDLEIKFNNFLREKGASNIRFYGTFNADPSKKTDVILKGYVNGDWKHEHLAFRYLVEDFAKENDFIIVNFFKEVTNDTGGDWYEAYYEIPMIEKTESAQGTLDAFRKMFSESKKMNEAYNDDEMKVYMNTWKNYNEYGADLTMYGDIDGWMSIEDAIDFAEEYAEDEPFINDTENIPDAFGVNEYSNAVKTLEMLKKFEDSGADIDILSGIIDSGYSSLEDALDKYEDGDYYWYPGVRSYEDLAHAVIDELGGLEYAIGDNIEDYIDEQQMKDDYEDDVRETMREDAKREVERKHRYDDEDDYDLDKEMEEWIDENIDSYLDEIVSEEIEMANRGEIDLSNYFDYEKYGRSLSYDGYVFTDNGAILCENLKNKRKKLYKDNRKNESIRYFDDEIKINGKQRKELNKICSKYCGWKEPKEIRLLWDELSDWGIDDITIMGYPDSIAEDGGKSWAVPFSIDGKRVVNSMLIYQVYEGSRSLKNDYNIYFS